MTVPWFATHHFGHQFCESSTSPSIKRTLYGSPCRRTTPPRCYFKHNTIAILRGNQGMPGASRNPAFSRFTTLDPDADMSHSKHRGKRKPSRFAVLSLRLFESPDACFCWLIACCDTQTSMATTTATTTATIPSPCGVVLCVP